MTSVLDGSSSFLQVARTTIKAWYSLNFGKIPSPTTELAALEHLKKSMYDIVTTLGHSFFIGFPLFLQETKTAIISWIGLKLGKIRLGTVELAALEHL